MGRKNKILSGVALIAVAVAMAASGAAWAADGITLDQATLNSIANIELQSYKDSSGAVGAAMGVSLDSGSKFSGGVGTTALGGSTAITGDTAFRIGSQTKTYVGTVVLQMVDQKKLSLSSTIGDVLGSNTLPTVNGVNYNNVTVDQLLRMNSGIPDYLSSPFTDPSTGKASTLFNVWNGANKGNVTVTEQQLVDQINKLSGKTSMWGTPGGNTPGYTNSNFTLLALMAEKVSGQSIDQLIQSNITSKLGLTNTYLATVATNPSNNTANFSHGYVVGAAGTGVTSTSLDFVNANPTVPGAAGAMISSVNDELVWVKQLTTNNQSLISADAQAGRVTWNADYMPVSNKHALYGQAIYNITSYTNNTLIGHSGLLNGYMSSVLYEPTTGLSLVANINTYDTYSADGNAANVITLLYNTEQAVYRASQASGSCELSGSKTTCNGSTVSTSERAIASGKTLQIKQSGQTGQLATTEMDLSTGEPVATNVTSVGINSYTYYGLNGNAVTLSGSGSLIVDKASGSEAQIAAVGTGSNAVKITGTGNSLEVAGNIASTNTAQQTNATTGVTTFSASNAILAQGSGNTIHLAETSQISGNITSTGANTLTADAGSALLSNAGTGVSLTGSTTATLNGTVTASHVDYYNQYAGAPPVVYGLGVSGTGNTATVGGTISSKATLVHFALDGTPDDIVTQVDPLAVGVSVAGSGNTLKLKSGSWVYGQTQLSGANTVTADSGSLQQSTTGTAVAVTGSTTATFNGTIKGAHFSYYNAYDDAAYVDTVTALGVSGSGNVVTVGGLVDTRYKHLDDPNTGAYTLTVDPKAVALNVAGSGNNVILAKGSSVIGNATLSGANTVTLNGTVTGDVTNGKGSTLNGTGLVSGTLSGAGTVAPSGMLSAASYTANGGLLSIAAPGQMLNTSVANLTGGALQVSFKQDGFYRIVQAADESTGTFSSVSINNGVVSYDNKGALISKVNPASSTLLSHNAATGMTSMTRMLTGHLATQRGAGADQRSQLVSFEQTSGDNYLENMANALGAAPLSTYNPESRIGAWASGYFNREMTKESGDTTSTNNRAYGLSAGGDYTLGNGILVGGLVGWQSEKGLTGTGSNNTGTVRYVGIYGGLPLPSNFTLDALAIVGRGENKVNRLVSTGGANSYARSTQNDDRYALDLRLSRIFQATDYAKLTPYIRASVMQVNFDGYTESGTGALIAKDSNFAQMHPEIGATANFDSFLGVERVRPRLGVSLGRDVVLHNPERTVQLSGLGTAFQVSGSSANRDTFGVNAGADVSLANGTTGSLDAGTDASTNSVSYKVLGKVKMNF